MKKYIYILALLFAALTILLYSLYLRTEESIASAYVVSQGQSSDTTYIMNVGELHYISSIAEPIGLCGLNIESAYLHNYLNYPLPNLSLLRDSITIIAEPGRPRETLVYKLGKTNYTFQKEIRKAIYVKVDLGSITCYKHLFLIDKVSGYPIHIYRIVEIERVEYHSLFYSIFTTTNTGTRVFPSVDSLPLTDPPEYLFK